MSTQPPPASNYPAGTPFSPPAAPPPPPACTCPRCRRRHIMGPIVLITIGVLFALQTIWHRWDVSRTWPVLLVVIGVVKLLQYFAPAASWHDQNR